MSNMMTINNVYQEVINEQNEDIEMDKPEIELKFSENLADEFVTTLNKFTAICAKMVKRKAVSKEAFDKFDYLYDKIKNLVNAAKNPNK